MNKKIFDFRLEFFFSAVAIFMRLFLIIDRLFCLNESLTLAFLIFFVPYKWENLNNLSYNPQKEKIKNYRIIPNPTRSLWKTNDGNTGVNKIIPQTISYTISFEKSFDQNGKEIYQSIKKTSVNKIAFEKHE